MLTQRTKKVRLILKAILCVVLVLVTLFPSTLPTVAQENVATTPQKQSSLQPLNYYDLPKGLYTSKQVTGPNEDGTYDVTIDTYTSNVTYLSAKTQTLDIMVLYDRSASMGAIGSNTRRAKFKQGLTQTLQTLTDDYGVGSTFKGQRGFNAATSILEQSAFKRFFFRQTFNLHILTDSFRLYECKTKKNQKSVML